MFVNVENVGVAVVVVVAALLFCVHCALFTVYA